MLAILLIIAGIFLWMGGYFFGCGYSEIKWKKERGLMMMEAEKREELWKKKWKTKWKEEMDKDD